MSKAFKVSGTNKSAPFSLTVYRGDGMALLGMNWKKGRPPQDFVGFAIEFKEPDRIKFKAIGNRIAFPGVDGSVNPKTLSSRLSPIQKFRWIHFPFNAELPGEFTYKVTPVFMDENDKLSYGEPQEAAIALMRETYPGQLNVCFTRGFVSSQAFVDRYEEGGGVKALLPPKAAQGLTFTPKHPKAEEALKWMGFEARSAILEVLDQAIADPTAQVRVVLYDLNEPGIVTRLEQLEDRLKVIIDDDGVHGDPDSPESIAAERLKVSAGEGNVKRQHMGKLQHNKIVVAAGNVKAAICGSTNHSWRGFFVQNNNAIILKGDTAVSLFNGAFEDYWKNDKVQGFGKGNSAKWNDLGLQGIDAQIGFSPRAKKNAALKSIAEDIASTTSNLFFSLAFLFQTKGAIQDAIKKIKADDQIFCYGISDHKVKGLDGRPETEGVDLQKPDGSVTVLRPEALVKNIPSPFKEEPTGGGGTRMHHKFVVIDFDKPTARVYMGSYNFSIAADSSNGENLLLIKDRRIATSYVVEAVRLFDHYHFRVAQLEAKEKKKKLQLSKPPRKAGEEAWWLKDYTDVRRIRDRKLFA
ncbi:MAG TPA: phospholipase D-like domain-containing protein [Pyrinomonadaceae bacterium]|jgi:phosphatidylserine/phosphatidylglycerophosphate/cardiolipin synthase-like enzyme|nr:phospholipase D-like domain-containing protein [Pyrinomonadaceae bacterium]